MADHLLYPVSGTVYSFVLVRVLQAHVVQCSDLQEQSKLTFETSSVAGSIDGRLHCCLATQIALRVSRDFCFCELVLLQIIS